jgi:hypothetical protein
MKVGDYVRTKSGIIGKIESKNYIGYSDWLIDTLYYNDDEIIDDWTCGVKEYDILKSSPNIIDLIEVGDYFNGMLVTNIWIDKETGNIEFEFNNHESYLYPKSWNYESRVTKYKIKSIVTKEQFKSMEYEV